MQFGKPGPQRNVGSDGGLGLFVVAPRKGAARQGLNLQGCCKWLIGLGLVFFFSFLTYWIFSGKGRCGSTGAVEYGLAF